MDANIMLGKYSLPFILSIILGLLFKRATIANDLKPYIAMAVGCVLGIAALFYNVPYGEVTFQLAADYSLQGGMAGAAATGIYEMTKALPGGSVYIPVDENNLKIPGARVVKVKKPRILR